MAVKYNKVGPGTLMIGEVGSEIDFSCQVTECVLTAEKDQEDNLTVLCGDSVAGDITYAYSLTGELIQDLSAGGINEFSHAQAGTEMPFTFEPNNTTGPTLAGMLIMDPLDVGGASNTKATAEFEFSVVGKPTWTAPSV